MTLAGKVPKMLITPTQELGRVLDCMHGLPLEGAVHLSTGVQARGRPFPNGACRSRRVGALARCGAR